MAMTYIVATMAAVGWYEGTKLAAWLFGPLGSEVNITVTLPNPIRVSPVPSP